jgi:ketosteroid isomerase-like protein
MQNSIWLVLLLASCSALGSGATGAADSLLAADCAFNRDVQERRLEGWLAAFDVNGSQVDESFKPITGQAAIGANMAQFFAEPTNSLWWEPDTAKISEGGRMGSTSGRYEVLRKHTDGHFQTLRTGRYFDVWRKLDDGTWKLLYDVGDPDR